MNTNEKNEESPVLIPPTDPVLRKRLEIKLEEYKRRVVGKEERLGNLAIPHWHINNTVHIG